MDFGIPPPTNFIEPQFEGACEGIAVVFAAKEHIPEGFSVPKFKAEKRGSRKCRQQSVLEFEDISLVLTFLYIVLL